MAPRFTGGHAPPVKRIKAQTSDKFPDNRLHYPLKGSGGRNPSYRAHEMLAFSWAHAAPDPLLCRITSSVNE